MNKELDKYSKEIVVILLSIGSSSLYKENSLTLFTNKLHTPIILNPTNYHYVALQEIGIDLNSGNIKIPNQKPGIIYFEWDTNFDGNLKLGGDFEILKDTFIKTYEKNKSSFFVNYPNSFGIYSNKGYIENKVYSLDAIEKELKEFDFFPINNFLKVNLTLSYIKKFIVLIKEYCGKDLK